MRRPIRFTSLALALAVALAAAAPARGAEWDPRKLPVPELNPVRTVKPERFVLPNGIVVYLLEDHALPVVSGTAYFPMGPALIPDDKVGLGTLTGEVMRSGGTAARSGDWLDDRLAAIGASVSTSVSNDLATGGFRCLAENASEVVGLWASVLRSPAFPEDKIELAKVGLRRAIAERNDEMTGILFRVASEAVYGAGNPYARKPEYATVEAIGAADCRALHQAVFVPNRMVLAVYGDFRAADMKKLLASSLGAWPKSATPAPKPGPDPQRLPARILFAPKDGVTQSGIVVAEPGSRADDPDYAALQVMETALGGSFQSRLFNRIRTQRGLAYATGANAGTNWRRPGVLYAYSLTKSESTMVALDLLREEMRRIIEEPLTADELKSAKQSVLNGFVFNFEQPSQVLFRSAFYEVNGYPADFLDRYQKALAGVDAQAVLEAARRKIHPAQQVIAIVGKEKDFDRPLDAMGLPVERVDLAIPPPPSRVAAAPATPEARAKAKAWLEQAAALAGGSAAWSGVKGVEIEQASTLTMQGQQLELKGKTTWVFPDRQLEVQTLPMGEIRQGVDGTSGWRAMMGQVQDDPKAVAGIREEWERSLWRLIGRAAEVEASALAEPVEVAGTKYAAAVVQGGAVRELTLLFDAEGRLAGIGYQGDGPQGPARLEVLYGDWQPAGGLQYPRAGTVLVDGEVFLKTKITSVKLDPEVTPDAFKKPGS